MSGLVMQIKSKYTEHMVDIGGCSVAHFIVSKFIKNSLPEHNTNKELTDFIQDACAFYFIFMSSIKQKNLKVWRTLSLKSTRIF